MAKITTITNPLTGQPAQVDQLEHTAQEIDDAIARALPGGAIDLEKAPAGYGLGGTAKKLTDADDLNNIRTTGWYCYHRSKKPANVPTPEVYSAVMEVIFGNFSGQTVQRVYSTGDDKDWNLVAQRVFYGSGGWQPWEWVNPLMKLGVEYRTTERYMGKPVYVKVIKAGFNPAGTVKETSDKTVSASGLVRFSAVGGAWAFPSLMYGGNYADAGNIQVAVQATSAGIYVLTLSKTRDMTSETVNVSVYYTKD